MARIEIYRLDLPQNVDRDVVSYGSYTSEQLKKPEPRNGRLKQCDENAYAELLSNSIRRALWFGFGIGEAPYVFFPNAEHFQHTSFAYDHWDLYGNMESEYSRINFMLDSYLSRRFPKEFDKACGEILASGDVLVGWSHYSRVHFPHFRGSIFESIRAVMDHQKVGDNFGYKNDNRAASQSEPVFYEVSEAGGDLEKQLWKAALTQVEEEMRSGNFENLPSFLDLYNHIKDPITPVSSRLSQQVAIFKSIYDQCSCYLPGDYNIEQMYAFISQLALESAFLSLPSADQIFLTVYGDYHELPYINVDLEKLPHGEFSNPVRVVEVIDELITASKTYGKAVMTPITVSHYQTPFDKEAGLFIVDGNNRATAILVMKFFSFVNFDLGKIRDFGQTLSEFIEHFGMGIKWERDIAVTLSYMNFEEFDKESIGCLLENREIVREFASLPVPALLVQEPSFHTIAVSLSGKESIVLLQPMHQAIYNEPTSDFAIPSKKQTHGRSGGNGFCIGLRREQ